MGLGRHSEEPFLKRTMRWVEYQRCFSWSTHPAQAERLSTCVTWTVARTKGVRSFAVKDFRQPDGDELFNEVQKSWLRSLVGVLGYLAADRLDLQYFVKNFMREITSRARGVVRYFVRKPHLAWSRPLGTQLEFLDVR